MRPMPQHTLCTHTCMHRRHDGFGRYRLLVSVGHDEYFSHRQVGNQQVCIHTHIHPYTHTPNTHTHTHTHIHIHTYTHTHIHTYTHTHMHPYTHTHIHTCIHAHTRLHAYHAWALPMYVCVRVVRSDGTSSNLSTLAATWYMARTYGVHAPMHHRPLHPCASHALQALHYTPRTACTLCSPCTPMYPQAFFSGNTGCWQVEHGCMG